MAETPVTGFDILNNTPPPLNMPTVSPLVSPETGMSQLAKRNIHPLVASVAPALYIAASATPLAPEEQNLVENWSKVKDIHDKLMSLPNNKAMEQFKLLQPDYQQALIQYYGVDYGTKPSNTDLIDSPEWQQQQTKQDQNKSLWGRTREIVASPFRAILHGAESYYQVLMTPIHALENAAINNQSFWSKKNWDAAYNGKMLYDNNELDKLMNEYGQEVSYLATHVLAGQSVGDIVKQYGSKNKAMLDEVSKLMNHPEEYNFILEKFSQARLSPGRDMARWTLKSFGMKTSEHAGLFKSISGVIDAATSILADPLTYLTLGGSSMLKGASTSTKLAENLLRSESIDLHFADPKVAAFWTGYSEQIDLLKKARAEKDFKKAAEISDNISFNFAEHGTKAEQEVFLSAAKAQDIAAGKVVPFDAKQYFSDANNLNQLVRGLSSNTLHTREGAAFARTSRARTLGAKRKAVEFFVGEPNFAKLDKDGIDKFLDDAQQLGADRTGVLDYSEMDKFVEQHTEKGFKAFLRRQTSYAPGSGAVNVTDDGVAKTIETFRRQAFVALNDRVLADTIAQHFLECSQAERINIKRFIDETTLRRFGVHNMGTEGKRFMDEMLNAKYGSKDSFTAREKLEIPEHFKTANAGQTVESQGPLMSHQFQDEIRPLDWRRVKEFTAGKYRGSNLAEESNMEKASRIIGGAYSNKITNAITDIWSVLTLVPQLGIRTAIDEGYQFAMYLNLPMSKEFFAARSAKNINQAITGAKSGPAKEFLFGALSKAVGKPLGASKFISQEERVAIQTKLLEDLSKKSGTMGDFHKMYLDELYNMAVAKYGKNLSQENKILLKQLTDANPRSMLDSTSSRNISSAMIGRPEDGFKTDAGFFPQDALNKAMEDHGKEATGFFNSIRADSMSQTDLQLHMFRQFVTHFNAHSFEKFNHSLSSIKHSDPIAIFLKNDGLKTSKNVEQAIDNFLSGFGIRRNLTSGNYFYINEEAAQKTRSFINSTTQFDKYRDMGEIEKVKAFSEEMFANIYNVFHGDANQFNQKLMDYFGPFVYGKVNDHRILINQMEFDKYKELTENFLAKGRIFTDLEAPNKSFTQLVKEYGINGAYDAMARQTDNILRQPAVHMHYLYFRKQYKLFEEKYAKQISDDIFEKAIAKHTNPSEKLIAKIQLRANLQGEEIAQKVYTHKAMNDAANHMLKFSDNPEMRTIFADNIRAVGRFYRAVEDFHRRSYRLVRDNGLGTLYKMRLMNQGFAAVGNIHKDDNGDQFVILPFDNIIYGAVNNTMRLLTGKEVGVNQPIFNNITFKLLAGNPSFQTDAGMPYLSGPLGAISVMAAKGLLSVPDVTFTNKLTNELDNFALGSYGDNINLQKALMPRITQNIWNALNPDEQSQQEVSALTQAICYNVANGINVPNPEDPKYLNNEALFNKDKADYLNQLKISAHNIIVTRSLLGTILPSTVQLSDTKDLPDYLKSAGLPSMQASFYDVLDAVKEKYPEVQEPIEMALATWIGDNPGKLVYTLSKKDKEITPIMKFSKQMETWVIENKTGVNKYGAGAVLFAPNTGKFNPGTYNFMESAGLTSHVDIKNFFDKALLQSAANKYYDLGREESTALRTVPFNDMNMRRAVINQYTQKRSMLQYSVSGLKEYLQSGIANQDAYNFIEDAHAFVNENPSSVNKDILEKINTAYALYNNFIEAVNQYDQWDVPNSSELKQSAKAALENQMKQLIASDDSKVIEQYYNYGIKKIANEHVRDSSGSLTRNY